MQWMGLNEIREKYLHFFEEKGHLRLESASLVPKGDKSLLLINSGMAPLKPYFTGQAVPPSRRVTTCQKCIRTPDIENVGKTARHGTFFEMLGNFSFGDYFKREATAWAWEFCTQVLALPVERLYVSIYEQDDEAYDIWTKEVGVDPAKMVRFGKEDNFWEIGSGPCGPCSELYFDRGPQWGCGREDCKVGCDCDRFIEFWNLVFTQFDSDGQGNYTPLEHPNIDTGMGLERMACIMQEVGNLFEVDTISAITDHICDIVGVKYRAGEGTDISLRVITDHIRSTTMLVSDGVMPSNEGRGYVLRRLLRRAARHGKLLGCNRPFLYEVADTVIANYGEAYPNLVEKRDLIKRVIRLEEERFIETIDAGLEILGNLINKHRAEGALPGEDVFRLYDTFGFPLDLTREILAEQGMPIDERRFGELMAQQRTRAREARAQLSDIGWSEDALSKLPRELDTAFVGYDRLEVEAVVKALVAGGALVEHIAEGDEGCMVITDATVFYPEGGGQVGDTGRIAAEGFEAEVVDTRKTADGKILHIVQVQEGGLSVGDRVKLSVDEARRRSITRNHTATHLLNMALRHTLGSHVTQAGSLVEEGRARFDFTHFEALTPEQLDEVERLVNEAILSATDTHISNMSMERAQQLGAIADFEEKYGDTVRVMEIPGYTVDLCGGCHLKNTAEAGLFKILSEGGISAGVRRIEAVTGQGVLQLLRDREALIAAAAARLRAKPVELLARVGAFVKEQQALQQTADALRSRLVNLTALELLQKAGEIGGVLTVFAYLPEMGAGELRAIGDRIRERHERAFALLIGGQEEGLTLFASATGPAVEQGVHAGNVIREVAALTGGKGGGKADSAQGGGRHRDRVEQAITAARELVERQLRG
ncbi:MAG: alanine--tRNA ligase [Clostridiales bacterium]|nr:alanine--tRNA ligase [Clostridiales bacterium]